MDTSDLVLALDHDCLILELLLEQVGLLFDVLDDLRDLHQRQVEDGHRQFSLAAVDGNLGLDGCDPLLRLLQTVHHTCALRLRHNQLHLVDLDLGLLQLGDLDPNDGALAAEGVTETLDDVHEVAVLLLEDDLLHRWGGLGGDLDGLSLSALDDDGSADDHDLALDDADLCLDCLNLQLDLLHSDLDDAVETLLLLLRVGQLDLERPLLLLQDLELVHHDHLLGWRDSRQDNLIPLDLPSHDRKFPATDEHTSADELSLLDRDLDLQEGLPLDVDLRTSDDPSWAVDTFTLHPDDPLGLGEDLFGHNHPNLAGHLGMSHDALALDRYLRLLPDGSCQNDCLLL